MAAWDRELKFSNGLVERRLSHGWSVADALTYRPNQKKKEHPKYRDVSCFGKTQNIAEWSRDTGVQYQTIIMRMRNGWPLPFALAFKSWPEIKSNKHLKMILDFC